MTFQPSGLRHSPRNLGFGSLTLVTHSIMLFFCHYCSLKRHISTGYSFTAICIQRSEKLILRPDYISIIRPHPIWDSLSVAWAGITRGAKDDLEFLTFLPPPPQCRDYLCTRAYPGVCLQFLSLLFQFRALLCGMHAQQTSAILSLLLAENLT